MTLINQFKKVTLPRRSINKTMIVVYWLRDRIINKPASLKTKYGIDHTSNRNYICNNINKITMVSLSLCSFFAIISRLIKVQVMGISLLIVFMIVSIIREVSIF